MLLLRYLKKLTKGGFLMEFLDLFENFNINGQLLLSEKTIYFKDIPWSKHPTFEGVEEASAYLKRNIWGVQLSFSKNSSK